VQGQAILSAFPQPLSGDAMPGSGGIAAMMRPPGALSPASNDI